MSRAVSDEVSIRRGFARNIKDEKRLRDAGIKIIYRADKGEVLGKFKMRRGELLGVVDGFLAFGERRGDWTKAEELIHGWGAAIYDIETKLRSDRHGAKMFDRAQHPPRPSNAYRLAQAIGVANRVKGRMPDRQALVIWRDPRFSTEEAIDLMFKWTQATAYKQLGKRDVPAGRRPK